MKETKVLDNSERDQIFEKLKEIHENNVNKFSINLK